MNYSGYTFNFFLNIIYCKKLMLRWRYNHFLPLISSDDFRSRAVVKGEAGFAKVAFLEAIVSQNQVNCNEWGYYKCKITYYDGNVTQTATSNSLLVHFIGKY